VRHPPKGDPPRTAGPGLRGPGSSLPGGGPGFLRAGTGPRLRFAIGDRDKLVFGPDGLLDLYVQHESPGPEHEANWLPAPRGCSTFCLRLYYPEPAVLDGRWIPPEVEPVD